MNAILYWKNKHIEDHVDSCLELLEIADGVNQKHTLRTFLDILKAVGHQKNFVIINSDMQF